MKAILTLALILGLGVISKPVYADDCGREYGGGDDCINKRFIIEKQVRIQGNETWLDKVTNVQESDVVEFKIKITNLSDEEADDFDNMEMRDILPSEMYRTGGSGLTEYWDNFEPGEKKTFILESKVDSDEYDREGNWEKCVVNKAEVYWDGTFEGADTATVCYGEVDLTELPETGAFSTATIAGLGLMFIGSLIKRKR